MEKTNGSPKGSQKLATAVNGQTAKPRRKPSSNKRSGFLPWGLSPIARLLTWYSIFTILFRCPATLEDCTDDSPRGCTSYFQIKQAVWPHVEPYYDSYAAPYVELAKPYYDTVDQKVLTPGWAYATKYGGPRVTQAQEFGQAQWKKNVQPELTKYQALAKAKYDDSLAPHVNKAYETVAPYYDIARTNALQTYHDVLLPSYVFVQPYAQQGYTTASTFTTETVVPAFAWTWNNTIVFLDSTVWPQLRYLYTENVEPQLVKIGQRIGRHNASNTQKVAETISSTAAKAASTITKNTSIASSASSALGFSSADTDSTVSNSSVTAPASSEQTPAASESLDDKVRDNEIAAPEAVPGESEVRRIARETVAQDLKDWQEKYTEAVDEGAIEIDESIDEIAKRMVERQANTMGKSLVKELRETIDTEVKTLRTDIQSIIGKVKAESQTTANAEEQIAAAVRKAGLKIKDKSQDVRDWSENYEKELQAAVLNAAENHFTLLSNIRDLALQKIGMKWAWMEGVTYKDWKKYHLLKERFYEWEGDLKDLVTNHPGLQAAEDAGRAAEGEAMDLAKAAAKQLMSLKQVSGWKLATLDDSDEFDPEATRSAAEEAANAKAAQAEESKAESDPVEPEAAAEFENVSEQSATESFSSTAEEVLASVAPGQAPEDAHDTPDLASTIILGEAAVMAEMPEASGSADAKQVNEAEKPNEQAAEEGAEDEDDTLAVEAPELSEPAPSVKPAFLGAAAQSVPSRQPVMDDDEFSFEAIGNIIAAMQSDVPATISAAATSAYSAAMSEAGERYSQALSLVSAQISKTPQPLYEQYLASITSAYGAAVAEADSGLGAALSAATGGFATTTSNAMLGLPTGWANVEAIAVSKLSENQAWVSAHYESAKIAIGMATATPTDVSGSALSAASVAGESLAAATAAAGENAQKLLHNAQHNYYAGLGVAQERYSQFLAAASSALSSMTATPTPTDLAGTLSSAESVARESASSLAAAGYDNVASVAGAAGNLASDNWDAVLDQIGSMTAAPTPTDLAGTLSSAQSVARESASSVAAAGHDNVAAAAEAASNFVSDNAAAGYDNVAAAAEAAGNFASEQWNAILDQVSAQVYGQPTPIAWYENVYSAAGDYAASATEAIGGSADAVTSVAGSYASVAAEEASKQYEVVSSLLSELLVGKEPTFSESVSARLAAVYAVAASSASSVASVASETVVSVATEATAAVKDSIPHLKDEL